MLDFPNSRSYIYFAFSAEGREVERRGISMTVLPPRIFPLQEDNANGMQDDDLD